MYNCLFLISLAHFYTDHTVIFFLNLKYFLLHVFYRPANISGVSELNVSQIEKLMTSINPQFGTLEGELSSDSDFTSLSSDESEKR